MVPNHDAPGQGPALSNRLTDLAERAGDAARRYRRGSIESIAAYLAAGELFAEAKGETAGKPKGTWGAFLARAGVDARNAQRMMQAWRIVRDVGADAEGIHEAGGIRAFVEAALHAADEAMGRAAQTLDGEPESVLGTFSAAPDSAPDEAPGSPVDGDSDSIATDGDRDSILTEPTGIAAGTYCAVCGAQSFGERLCGACAHRERVGAHPPVEPPGGAGGAADGVSEPRAVYGVLGAPEGRVEARPPADSGKCRCGRKRAPGRRQCEPCLSRDRARTRERLAGGRYAGALARRLRAAAAAGRGLSLSAGDVARLLGR